MAQGGPVRLIFVNGINSTYPAYSYLWILLKKIMKYLILKQFLSFQHPGGCDVMLEHIGYDASQAFLSVGHSQDAMEMLEEYLVGILPKYMRAYEYMSCLSFSR